jgi:hypothetical protein
MRKTQAAVMPQLRSLRKSRMAISELSFITIPEKLMVQLCLKRFSTILGGVSLICEDSN